MPRTPLSAKFLLLALALTLCTSLSQAADIAALGTKVDDFTLKSHFGKEYSLADFADRELVVVVFLGAECPLAKLYGPRLATMASELEKRGVAFVGIDSNQQDSLQEIAAYAQRHKIGFPILKDPKNTIADRFAAQRTPEAFVLDRGRVVRYRGRVDDQYGFADKTGYQRPAPSRRDLAEAINELLAGKAVSVPTSDAIGCHIGRVKPVKADSDVTYSNQIAGIFQNHCIECHRAGRIGPFQMTSYAEVVGWGEMIREVVDQGRMPPWHANPAHGEFVNDVRLSDADKKLISTWVDNGCPEGNPADLPASKTFVDGWEIGQPDQIVQMGDAVDVPAEGVIDYFHFSVDPGWTEDKWIKAAEAKPGSPEVVHHILVFVQPPGEGSGRGSRGGTGAGRGEGQGFGRGDRDRARAADGDSQRERDSQRGRDSQGGGERRGGGGGRGRAGGIGGGNLIAGYAPGMNPMLATDGKTAMLVKAGSKLIFQMHYTPNGSAQKDRSYVGFQFADPKEVEFVARSASVVNRFFTIPPGDGNYQAVAEGTFEHDTQLVNMTPHMHTRGKSFRYEATYPDGKQEVLLDVPGYDFNWQTTYQFKNPKMMPKGTKLVCTAHWDNSEDNLSNPDPSKAVSWGDQTWEEMMIGFYVEVFPKGQVPERPSGGFGRVDPETVFKSLDANGDGKLTKDELPGRIADRFELADGDGDGAVSKKELTRLLRFFGGQGGRGQGQ